MSSAYIINLEFKQIEFRSLVNKTNKRGSKIEPWGTPEVIAAEEEVAPRTVTDCEQSVR